MANTPLGLLAPSNFGSIFQTIGMSNARCCHRPLFCFVPCSPASLVFWEVAAQHSMIAVGLVLLYVGPHLTNVLCMG
jgi:hypothetical protein